MKSRFEWDPTKAASNFFKHGVSFNEAMTVFDDPDRLLLPDRGTPRWQNQEDTENAFQQLQEIPVNTDLPGGPKSWRPRRETHLESENLIFPTSGNI